eukprot:scaffold53892_cov16-Tisochrysis_lutea.AAC.1
MHASHALPKNDEFLPCKKSGKLSVQRNKELNVWHICIESSEDEALEAWVCKGPVQAGSRQGYGLN